MDLASGSTIIGRDGVRGSVELQEGEVVLVRLVDGGGFTIPTSELRERPDGIFETEIELGSISVVGTAVGSQVGTVVVPVVSEEVEFGKRVVETGRVRISKHVETREEIVDLPLMRQQVEVERVPNDRLLEGPVEPRWEGDVFIVPVVEEVLVIEKRLRLREEVRITTRRVEEHHPKPISLRTERIEVERLGLDGETER